MRNMKIDWIDSTTPEVTSHAVFRDDVEIADVPNGTETYTDANAEDGYKYKYEVQAKIDGTVSVNEVIGVNVMEVVVPSLLNLAVDGDGDLSIELRGKGTIDWGDGSAVEDFNYTTAGVRTHTYAAFTGTLVIDASLKLIEIYAGAVTAGVDISTLPQGLEFFNNQGDGVVSGDVSSLPAGLTFFGALVSSLTGSINNLPLGITDFVVHGDNDIDGVIDNLPIGIDSIIVRGDNTISGSINNMPRTLNRVELVGLNTVSGNLNMLPSAIESVYIGGSNTITGDIAQLPNTIINYWLEGDGLVGYTAGKTFNSGIVRLVHKPITANALTSDQVDAILVDLDNSGMHIADTVGIDLSGENESRTTASDAAVTSLEGRGITVTTN